MLRIEPRAARAWAVEELGAVETEGNPDEFSVPACPMCGDDKKSRHRLNVAKGLFYCFRNGCTASLLDLVRRHHGLTKWQALELLSDYGARFEFVFGAGREGEPGRTWTQRAKERIEAIGEVADAPGQWLPPKWSTDWSTPSGREALRYAEKRRVPAWFAASGRMGYSLDRKWRDRLVALVVEKGVPISAVGRLIGRGEPKYYRPTSLVGASASPVFNLDLVEPGQTMLICEGWLSALSAGPGGVATLGQAGSEAQAVKMARAGADMALLLLERGASRPVATDFAALLTSLGLPTLIAPLGAADPNDDPGAVARAASRAIRPSLAARVRGRLAGPAAFDPGDETACGGPDAIASK